MSSRLADLGEDQVKARLKLSAVSECAVRKAFQCRGFRDKDAKSQSRPSAVLLLRGPVAKRRLRTPRQLFTVQTWCQFANRGYGCVQEIPLVGMCHWSAQTAATIARTSVITRHHKSANGLIECFTETLERSEAQGPATRSNSAPWEMIWKRSQGPRAPWSFSSRGGAIPRSV